MDVITETSNWFVEANQQPEEPTPDIAQIGFYIGMQCEELGEKLELIDFNAGENLRSLGAMFKAGLFSKRIAILFLDPDAAQELLDGDMDLIWVSIGAARSQGADVAGAYEEVSNSNYSKRWTDGKFHNDPETKKVLKPADFEKPNLKPFLHKSLKGLDKGAKP